MSFVTTFKKSRLNPFDKSAIGAKIPDGKATVSNALRVQAVKEFTVPVATGIANILFYPGLNAVAYMDITTNIGTNTLSYANHVRTDIAAFSAQTPGPATFLSEKLLKWRVVSQALRVTMLNNADENDGWFECIRVDPTYADPVEQLRFDLMIPGGAVSVRDKAEIPFISETIPEGNWANHPTYVSGKIRDLHQYMWKLNSISTDHEFSDMDLSSGLNLSNSQIDTHMDCIAIRLHGRKGTGVEPTRVIMHAVSNQELIFDESTVIATTATKCARGGRSQVGDMVTPARVSRSNTRYGYSGFRRSQSSYRAYRPLYPETPYRSYRSWGATRRKKAISRRRMGIWRRHVMNIRKVALPRKSSSGGGQRKKMKQS